MQIECSMLSKIKIRHFLANGKEIPTIENKVVEVNENTLTAYELLYEEVETCMEREYEQKTM